MRNAIRKFGVIVGCVALFGAICLQAQDWPQWRGPNRDGKAVGFKPPATWPKELKKGWSVTVGDGVATPALVGDKLFVFAREGGNEVIRCLSAADGKEIWQEKYEAKAPDKADKSFPGPRSSPTVADGKVVTLGLQGVLCCWDAATGKKLWQKDDFKGALPQFHTSSSPLITDGLCIAQVGGESNGGIVAYNLATGAEKWKWTRDGTAYASPILVELGGVKAVVAETAKSVVAVSLADGKLLWETPWAKRQMQYNSATPMVEGQTVICSGSGNGAKAIKIEKEGDTLTGKELWSTTDNGVKFNTPVLKNGLIFGISARDELFCVNAQTGKPAWTKGLSGGGGRQSGYGSVVDAGPVLFALNPGANLIVFEPSDKEFKEVASYKVGTGTYAYPVIAGNRIFIKDKDSVTLYTIE
jgi:outer membrane protein assembly factor BamB